MNLTKRVVLDCAILSFCLFAVGVHSSRSQDGMDSLASVTSDAEDGNESLLDQVETENDNSEQIDRLEWLQEHPFNLNTVRKEELATIPRLTPGEVAAIVNFRKMVKRFMSVEHLAAIDGNGEEILRKVRPYVMVEEVASAALPGTTLRVISRMVRDLQSRQGFQDRSFAGTPLKSYNRISLDQAGSLQAGSLFEKDAGEKFGDGFVSGYVALKNWSFVSQAIVGDYVIEAGQGLVFWRASAFGKGSEAVSAIKKSGLCTQPYRSADEFNFLRGATVSSRIDVGESNLAITALYSRRLLSASSNNGTISSFYEGGLYRTQLEIQKKSNVAERMFGGRVQFNSADDWSVGGSLYQSTFDKPIVADRMFEFEGTSARVFGIDGEVNLGWLGPKRSQITLFGEAARSGDGGNAVVAGSILHLSRNSSLALVYRNYSPRFIGLHSTGFGERSDTKNERGFYIGAEVNIASWLRFNSYLDHFKFPWRTFDNPFPASGRDYLMQADASVSRVLDLSLRYSNKTTESGEAAADEFSREIRILVDRSQQKFRLTASYQADKRVRLRGRIEKTIVQYSLVNRTEHGLLFYQELQYSFPLALTAEVRLVFFQTDSYDSRVYEYENDLRGMFSNPALSGKGRRWYALVRWKAAGLVELSAKYSETQFDDRTTIGTGATQIQGDLDNRIAVQVELKF